MTQLGSCARLTQLLFTMRFLYSPPRDNQSGGSLSVSINVTSASEEIGRRLKTPYLHQILVQADDAATNLLSSRRAVRSHRETRGSQSASHQYICTAVSYISNTWLFKKAHRRQSRPVFHQPFCHSSTHHSLRSFICLFIHQSGCRSVILPSMLCSLYFSVVISLVSCSRLQHEFLDRHDFVAVSSRWERGCSSDEDWTAKWHVSRADE